MNGCKSRETFQGLAKQSLFTFEPQRWVAIERGHLVSKIFPPLMQIQIRLVGSMGKTF
jgi:hypothetical protein